MTIQNAHHAGSLRLRHGDRVGSTSRSRRANPVSGTTFDQFSARRYEGYFHTDHLIPSVFFQKGQPTSRFRDLGLAYMHDMSEEDYAELMGGETTRRLHGPSRGVGTRRQGSDEGFQLREAGA